MADRGGRVVAVLGYSERGTRGLHPICAARLAHAETLAAGAEAVVLSGWARHPDDEAEAELMRAAWAGPDVPLVLDPTARHTSGNAAGIAAVARRLHVADVVVVTSRWHRRRALALVRAALRGAGVRVSASSPGGRPRPANLLREVAGTAALPLQVARLARRRR
jgi:uncharacterized SAM-binding protein YcdF (DUF218 family)